MTTETGDIVRNLMRGASKAVLATEMRDTGAPYASLILVAWSHGCDPLFLLSDLADHTKNLHASPRGSLLIDGTEGLEDPLTGARVTLQGEVQKISDDVLKARFIARHPSASFYGTFKDFNLYQMTVERAHLVAGFGKIHWINAEDFMPNLSDPFPLAAQEADVVSHMNEDHSDAVALYANRLLNADGVGWQLCGVDRDGADLLRAGQHLRLSFKKPVEDAEQARVELVRLVKQARQ